MRKEKKEKIPEPGRKLSSEQAEEIIDRFNIQYREDEKEAEADLEYFIIRTRDRGPGPEQRKKEISHYIPKWEKIPDEELGWIPVEEVIEAIRKYYPGINEEEKFPTRKAIKKLRQDKQDE